MMNYLKKGIINIDFIGFPVALNFDKKGNQAKKINCTKN